LTRLLGIDLGTRRIGVAIGDEQSAVVRPLATLRRSTTEHEQASLRRLADDLGATEIVVGLPLNMDGSEGEQAALTRAWAHDVVEPLGLPVCWRDERLTSERAQVRARPPRRGRAGGPPTRAQRTSHRAALDRQAASLILESEMAARRELAAGATVRGDAS
jgi:putative holliday junction resolvase